MNTTGLGREVGLVGAVAYGLGVIVGAGLHALIGKGAGHAGNSLRSEICAPLEPLTVDVTTSVIVEQIKGPSYGGLLKHVRAVSKTKGTQ